MLAFFAKNAASLSNATLAALGIGTVFLMAVNIMQPALVASANTGRCWSPH